MPPPEPFLSRAARWLTFGSAVSILLSIAISQILLALALAALLAGAPFREQRHLFYPLKCLRKDRFGADAVEWRHPVSGKLRQTSLDQLADETVQRITTLFEHIETKGSLADVLRDSPGENLLTGMHGACLNATGYNGTG